MERLTLNNVKQSLIHHSHESENASKGRSSCIQSTASSTVPPFAESCFSSNLSTLSQWFLCCILAFLVVLWAITQGGHLSIIFKGYTATYWQGWSEEEESFTFPENSHYFPLEKGRLLKTESIANRERSDKYQKWHTSLMTDAYLKWLRRIGWIPN